MMLRNETKRKRTPYTKFSLFLREHNIPQSEIAELLNKGVAAVNQNINGTGGDFTVSEVVKICNKYEISTEIFFN
jgi:hypothetical protein